MKRATGAWTTVVLVLCAGAGAALDKPVNGSITGQVTIKGAKTPEGTVVYLRAIEGKTFPAPEKHVVMDQKNLKFIPHVLPVLAGTTVDFLNSDDVLHNVFTPDACAEKFNLGSWPKGQTRSYSFKKSGDGAVCTPVLLCNVHPEMEAFVVVLPTPYYATAGADGSYRIDGVPPGAYEVTTWHEKCQKTTVEKVSVSAGQAARVDFSIRR